MTLTTTSRARQILRRLAATWSELDHAQRRLLEIQTGITGLTLRRDPRTRGRVGEHESHL